MKTPVLLLVFNRPDLTEKVMRAIREVKPQRIFVAADGPRDDQLGEGLLCEETRSVVESSIDWPCELVTLYRDGNLGCGKAVTGAIDWFFENVEEGIILEDDTVPHASFFSYCECLLERYRDSLKLMSIGGFGQLSRRVFGGYSYGFSKYNLIWGWASWRRAWCQRERSVEVLKAFINGPEFDHLFSRDLVRNYWYQLMHAALDGKIDTWDYQWRLSIWMKRGISTVPSTNLVENIGFDERATHTKYSGNKDATRRAVGFEKPIRHPTQTEVQQKVDYLLEVERWQLTEGHEGMRYIFMPLLRKLRSVLRACAGTAFL